MNETTALQMIVSAISDLGTAVLTIVTATLVVGLGYLVFTVGWSRIFMDKSLMIGGLYLRNTPYKGYNRWRSKAWNMKNTM